VAIHPKLQERLMLIEGKYEDTWAATAQELRLYVWLHEFFAQELLEVGGEEVSWVFRRRGDMTLLVYKAQFDGIQRVVFITARTPTRCIKSLCRQFYNDQLKWVPDKYA